MQQQFARREVSTTVNNTFDAICCINEVNDALKKKKKTENYNTNPHLAFAFDFKRIDGGNLNKIFTLNYTYNMATEAKWYMAYIYIQIYIHTCVLMLLIQ